MRAISHWRQVCRDDGKIRTFGAARPTFEPLAPPRKAVVGRAHFQQLVEANRCHPPTPAACQLGGDDILEPARNAIKFHRVTLAMFSFRSQ